jgi:predicted RNA polymerase sigma factor
LNGPKAGIEAIESIKEIEALKNYYLLPSVLGALYKKMGDTGKANEYFKEAARLTGNEAEKKLLLHKLE